MAWERRERGGAYYTRSRRESGRIVREYIGGGLLGEMCAELDTQLREIRHQAARLGQDERMLLAARDAALDEYYREVDRLMAAELTVLGLHRHRGEWRRARDQQ